MHGILLLVIALSFQAPAPRAVITPDLQRAQQHDRTGWTLVDAKDFAGAADLFSGVLQNDPENMQALGGLIRCFVALGELAQARGLLAGLTAEHDKHAAIVSARAALELAAQAEKLGSPSDLRRRLEENPNDHQTRFDLAVALNGQGDRTGATDALLEIVRRNRGWNEEAARKQLVQFFEAWGVKDPAAIAGRQRLSLLLFA